MNPAEATRNDGRLHELLAWAGTTGAVLLLLYHRLLWGYIVLSRDAGRMAIPMKAYFAERIRAGELPLWYPYDGLGTPFAGSAVTAVFHPLTWLALPLGAVGAQAVSTLIVIVLLSGGVWRLTRALGGSRLAAVLAVVFATGGGSTISMLDNQPFAWAAPALPWFLYGVYHSVREAPWRGTAWAGLSVGWVLLAGDVQGVMILAILGLPAAVSFGWPRWPRAVGRLGLAGLLGIMVGAVQLVVSLPVFLGSSRSGGLDWEMSVRWSMHPLRLPELILGDVLRTQPVNPDGAYELLELGGRIPWQLSVFLGALVPVGILYVLLDRRRPRPRAHLTLLGLGGLALWLALGKYGGLWWVFRQAVPLWDGFRYPEKLLPYAQLLLAIVAGQGLSWALPRPSARQVLTAAAVAASYVVGGGLLAILPAEAGTAREAWLSGALENAVRDAALVAGIGVLLLATHRGLIRPSVLALALTALSLGDLVSQHGRIVRDMTGSPALLEAPAPLADIVKAETLPGPGAPRIAAHLDVNLALLHEDASSSGFGAQTLWERAALAPNHNADQHLPGLLHYLPGLHHRVRTALAGDKFRFLIDRAPAFNVRFFTFTPQFLATGQLDRGLVRGVWPHLGLALVERPDALPRMYLAKPRWTEGPEAALAGLSAQEVQDGTVGLLEGPAPARGYPPADGSVEIIAYEDRRIAAHVEAQTPALLVHSDAWSDQWRCSVDGEPARLLHTNYLVRGLLVERGSHRLVCDMPTPPATWVGLTVSALTALVLLGSLFLGRPR